MLKIIGGVTALIFVVFLIVVASRPAEFRIERAVTISAPPSIVFPHVSDLRKWSDWSPWEKLDPGMKKTYTGPDYGVGANYSWEGDDKVGSGMMTVTELRALESVQIKLDFIKPWKATNLATITLKVPAGDSTVVTWAMEGENNFMAKAFGLFVDVNEIVGKDFESGLQTLKGLCEAEARKAAAPQPAPATPPPGAPADMPLPTGTVPTPPAGENGAVKEGDGDGAGAHGPPASAPVPKPMPARIQLRSR